VPGPKPQGETVKTIVTYQFEEGEEATKRLYDNTMEMYCANCRARDIVRSQLKWGEDWSRSKFEQVLEELRATLFIPGLDD
jgi:hypothetical protein